MRVRNNSLWGWWWALFRPHTLTVLHDSLGRAGPQLAAEAEHQDRRSRTGDDPEDLRTCRSRASCLEFGDCERYGSWVLKLGDAVTNVIARLLRRASGGDDDDAAVMVSAFTLHVQTAKEGAQMFLFLTAHALYNPYRVTVWRTDEIIRGLRGRLRFTADRIPDFAIVYGFLHGLPVDWNSSLSSFSVAKHSFTCLDWDVFEIVELGETVDILNVVAANRESGLSADFAAQERAVAKAMGIAQTRRSGPGPSRRQLRQRKPLFFGTRKRRATGKAKAKARAKPKPKPKPKAAGATGATEDPNLWMVKILEREAKTGVKLAGSRQLPSHSKPDSSSSIDAIPHLRPRWPDRLDAKFVKLILGEDNFSWVTANHHAIYFDQRGAALAGPYGVYFAVFFPRHKATHKGNSGRTESIVLHGSRQQVAHPDDHARAIRAVFTETLIEACTVMGALSEMSSVGLASVAASGSASASSMK